MNPRWKRELPTKNGQSAITKRHKLLEVHHVELSDEDDLSNRLGKYQSALQIRRARGTRQGPVLQNMAQSGSFTSTSSSESS